MLRSPETFPAYRLNKIGIVNLMDRSLTCPQYIVVRIFLDTLYCIASHLVILKLTMPPRGCVFRPSDLYFLPHSVKHACRSPRPVESQAARGGWRCSHLATGAGA